MVASTVAVLSGLFLRESMQGARERASRQYAAPAGANGAERALVVQSYKLFLIGHKMTTNDLVAINTRNCLQVDKIYINLDNGKLKVY